MRRHFCWQCSADMPFLEEMEWQEMEPLLSGSIEKIKTYRQEHQSDLATACKELTTEAQSRFEALTGYKGVPLDAIFHHRLASWGPPCRRCGHLLRSKEASFCASCGESALTWHEVKEQWKSRIREVDWTGYKGTVWYRPESVKTCLLDLVDLDETESTRLYDSLLFALGNNHAGTYFPALGGALPFLILVATRSENEVARKFVLCVLSDLVASFEPDVECFPDEGERKEFQRAIRSQILSVFGDPSQIYPLESAKNLELIAEITELSREEP